MNGWPDEPCVACPRVARGLSIPCLAQTTRHPRLCEHAAAGHAGYIALICGEDPPARSFPPLMQQARNLAGAVADAVASGGKTVGPEEKARRLTICHDCDQLVDGRCLQCGCVMSWKVRLEAWSCPIGKW